MKIDKFMKPCCKNCLYLNSISVIKKREKTDDGGVHYKYLYDWEIDCQKEGKFKTIIEGTKNMCEVPHCSLWRKKE